MSLEWVSARAMISGYKNSQAFMCYLWSSIQLLEPPGIIYHEGYEPLFPKQNWDASFVIYLTWKQIIQEPPKLPFNSQWKDE